ncbi:MAG TPA: hypothetical protein VM285_08495, partial [Polyangia bacterium]|nr:hypothetical protein [Polyangia bacterium]
MPRAPSIGLAAVRATLLVAVAAAPARAWEPGKILLGDPDGFHLSPTALVQPEAALVLTRNADDRTAGSGFSLERAEAGLRAGLDDAFGIELVADFAGGVPALLDAFIAVQLLDEALEARAGWFRPPLGRQFGLPAAFRQLARDARSWSLLDLQREPGVELRSNLLGLMEIAAGAWSAGEEQFSVDRDPVVGGRLAVLPLGDESQEVETHLGGAVEPALSIGVAALYGPRRDRLVPFGAGETYDDHRLRAGAEIAFAAGSVTATAEGFWMRTWTDDAAPDSVVERLPPVDGVGAYLQAGWQILPGTLEVAARFDWSDADLLVAGSRFHPAAGVTWFVAGHGLKLQAFYGFDFALDDPFLPGTAWREPDFHTVAL